MDAKLLTWQEARIILYHYFNFWKDGEDRIWAKKVWYKLEDAGLTVYRTEDEEMVVRSRVAILALIYQEFCSHTQYLMDSDAYCQPLQDLHYKEIFSDSKDQINEQIYKLMSVLFNDEEVKNDFAEIFESVYRGASGSQTPSQVEEEIEEAINRADDYGTSEYSAYRFLVDGSDNIDKFESCSAYEYF